MKRLIYIFIGGFFGALLRNLFFNIPFLSDFQLIPLNTLIVNLLGCFFLSLTVHLAEKSIKMNDNLHAALATGLLGAFTTFSTFSKNLADLIYSTNFFLAAIYMIISLLGGLIMVYLAYLCANNIYAKKLRQKNKFM